MAKIPKTGRLVRQARKFTERSGRISMLPACVYGQVTRIYKESKTAAVYLLDERLTFSIPLGKLRHRQVIRCRFSEETGDLEFEHLVTDAKTLDKLKDKLLLEVAPRAPGGNNNSGGGNKDGKDNQTQANKSLN